MFAGLSELKRHQNKDPFNLLKIHVRPAGKRPLLFQGRLAIRGPEAETHETMQKYAKNQISIEKKKGFDIQPRCAWMRLPPWRQQPRSRVSDQTLACWNIQDCIRTGRRRIDKMTARKTTWNAEKASQRPLTERNGAFMHGPFAGALSAPFLLALFCHCDAELFQCKPPHFSVCGSFF